MLKASAAGKGSGCVGADAVRRQQLGMQALEERLAAAQAAGEPRKASRHGALVRPASTSALPGDFEASLAADVP